MNEPSFKLTEFKHAPYSASKLKTFDECPHKFHQHYVLKIRPFEEPKPYFEKGTFLHWILEHYPNLPEKSFKFRLASKEMREEWLELAKKLVKEERVRDIIDSKVKSEMKFSLTSDFKPVKFKKKTSLLMGYVDNISKCDIFQITDWKTGKSRVSEDDIQLKLYALWFLLGAENIQEVKCTYAFLEQEEWINKSYKRSDIDSLKSLFIGKIETIETCEDFIKKPSRNCNYCDHFSECLPFKFKVGEKK